MSRFVIVLFSPLIFLPIPYSFGQKSVSTLPFEKSVEELTKSSMPAIVVIRFTGRTGKQEGLGSGFVISKDGLIATNLHVIGEARPIAVEIGGKEYQVKSVHASDRSLDLALLKIEAKDLPTLELGDSDRLKDGQDILALGHPRGLKNSVVKGVVSGRPTIDGRKMIQLAIPIEQGNSGGPVLDRQGKVQGIVTLKSLVTRNLGFAVPVNALKRLLKKPNPIAMEHWVTIGRLNPDEWETVFSGRWRQRNGRIIVDGPGEGFGGRTLCLSKSKLPEVPFEVGVMAKLDDESGAGGLVIHSDGRNKHYGFYPSNSRIRFSRFEGPNVFSWKVLFEDTTPHYRPGEWNYLKVRVEKDRIKGYVNDELIHESTDQRLRGGRVGLVKFRTTHIEFKGFRIAKSLPSIHPPKNLVQKVEKLVRNIEPGKTPDEGLLTALAPTAENSMKILRERARYMVKQAEELRLLAKAVHEQKVLSQLKKETDQDEKNIDLLHAAFLIDKLDNENRDLQSYIKQVERITKDISESLSEKATEKDILAALNRELFKRRGFHGSRADYYNRANSYLSQVLDDREGIPITLSLLYMEIAQRLNVKVVGIGLPGHFVVQHQPRKGQPYLIDVYEGGVEMSREEAEATVKGITGLNLREKHLKPVSKKAIVVRMIHNLVNIARSEKDLRGILRYQNAILAVDSTLGEERLHRAAARYQLGDKKGAIADLDILLENPSPEINRERLLELRKYIRME